ERNHLPRRATARPATWHWSPARIVFLYGTLPCLADCRAGLAARGSLIFTVLVWSAQQNGRYSPISSGTRKLMTYYRYVASVDFAGDRNLGHAQHVSDL